MRGAGALAALLLAGCVTETAPPMPVAIPEPSPVVKAEEQTLGSVLEASSGPSLVVSFELDGLEAQERVRNVAAACWLDHVVGGATMFADERSGSLLIMGEESDLVSASFLAHSGAGSRLRLAGKALEDETVKARLITTLDTAVQTGETSCPPASG
ncbi:MAG: hypothetical protein AAGE80_15605 [Pseudomonadota bacterium]